MKRILLAGICAAMLCLTACGGTQHSSENSSSSGLTVHADEAVDSAYTDALKSYFLSIEQKDFETYQSLMYPPYLESFSAYLKKKDKTLAENFDTLCKRFDEDGYESWTLTDLHVSYYPEEKLDMDGFFDAFKDEGIIDEKLIEDCKKNSEEIRDVEFTLYALYAGDEDPVPVVNGNEVMMVKTKEGTYLFG